MLVDIQGRKMEVTPALKSYTLEKVSVLNKYLDGNVRVHVTMSVGKKFRQNVEVSVNGQGAHFKGSEESEDMYASVDLVMDKIVRQAKRFKEKQKDHHVRGDKAHPADASEEAAMQEIIRENMDSSIEMSDEEAITELRDGNRHFVVYRINGNDGLKVAYYRSDGNIGILKY